MLKIKQDTTQLIISADEAQELLKEFEEMFCIVDNGRRGGFYSMNWIKEHFPSIAELYNTI